MKNIMRNKETKKRLVAFMLVIMLLANTIFIGRVSASDYLGDGDGVCYVEVYTPDPDEDPDADEDAVVDPDADADPNAQPAGEDADCGAYEVYCECVVVVADIVCDDYDADEEADVDEDADADEEADVDEDADADEEADVDEDADADEDADGDEDADANEDADGDEDKYDEYCDEYCDCDDDDKYCDEYCDCEDYYEVGPGLMDLTPGEHNLMLLTSLALMGTLSGEIPPGAVNLASLSVAARRTWAGPTGDGEMLTLFVSANLTINGVAAATSPAANVHHGNTGVTVSGNVTLIIEDGVTLNINGSAGNTGRDATLFASAVAGGNGGNGIHLAPGAHLTIIGSGTLNAAGGSGGNGGDGIYVIRNARSGGAGGSAVDISAGATLTIGIDAALTAAGGTGGAGGDAGGVWTDAGHGGNGGNGITNNGTVEVLGTPPGASGAGGGGGIGTFGSDGGPGASGVGITTGGNIVGAPVFRVEFYNGDVFISYDMVFRGGNATPPADQTRDGYTFTGWTDYTNITADRRVYAQFSRNGELTFWIVGGTWAGGGTEPIIITGIGRGLPITNSIPSGMVPGEGRQPQGVWTPGNPVGVTMPSDGAGLGFTYTFPMRTYNVTFHKYIYNDTPQGTVERNVPWGTSLGEIENIPVFTRDGYTLIGWRQDNAGDILPVDLSEEYPPTRVTGEMTFYAQWEKDFDWEAQPLVFGTHQLAPDMLLNNAFISPLNANQPAVTFAGTGENGWGVYLTAKPLGDSLMYEWLHMGRGTGKTPIATPHFFRVETNGTPPSYANPITWYCLNAQIEVPNNTSIDGPQQAQLVWTTIPPVTP